MTAKPLPTNPDGTRRFYSLVDLQNMGFGSRPTLLRRVRSGELEAQRWGNKIVVTEQAIARMLANLPSAREHVR